MLRSIIALNTQMQHVVELFARNNMLDPSSPNQNSY